MCEPVLPAHKFVCLLLASGHWCQKKMLDSLHWSYSQLQSLQGQPVLLVKAISPAPCLPSFTVRDSEPDYVTVPFSGLNGKDSVAATQVGAD